MVDTPEIPRTVAQPAAVIRLTVARADIQNVMGPAIGEVIATVTRPSARLWCHRTADVGQGFSPANRRAL